MTRAVVKDGEFHFDTPRTHALFMRANEGKEIKLEPIDKITPEIRKYFEGCLVPAFFYFHPHSHWKNFADAREAIKLEFGPGGRTISDIHGQPIKVAPSTSNMSNKRFALMVESLTQWFMENGMPLDVLDPEEYKRWRDTNFDIDIYPPLKRLKDSYDRQLGV